MEFTISATDLARSVGDVLGRIRYVGDSFVIERNGEPVAWIGPLPGQDRASVAEALAAWSAAGAPDAAFARDLEEVSERDAPPESPWAS